MVDYKLLDVSMLAVLQRFKLRWNQSSERSRQALIQIGISMLARSVSIVVPLLIVPLTIDYVNPIQYGIWLTLSSIIAWVMFLDLGLGNGFRNKFAEAKAKGEKETAHKYVSTTYFSVGVVVTCAFVLIMIINQFVDWSEILKVDTSYSLELHKVFAIVCGFFCCTLVLNVFSSLLAADQKTGLSSVIQGTGQLCSLLVIWILTKTTEGSLLNLALYFSGIPCVVMLISSVMAFSFTRYREYVPKLKLVDLSLARNILSLGIRFFFIFLTSITIFQIINIVLSREIGPESVTEYNVAYKYFAILYSVISIIISPFWSAFTDAYHKNDYAWMRGSIRKLEKTWWMGVAIGLLMLLLSQWVYGIWIGDAVRVPFYLSLGVMIYILSQSLGAIYMHIINGLGTIRIQLIVYCFYAIISWPLLTFLCRTIGVAGVVILPIIVYMSQALVGKIQIHKIMNHTATGIWTK